MPQKQETPVGSLRKNLVCDKEEIAISPFTPAVNGFNISLGAHKVTVTGSIKDIWGSQDATAYFTWAVPVPIIPHLQTIASCTASGRRLFLWKHFKGHLMHSRACAVSCHVDHFVIQTQ